MINVVILVFYNFLFSSTTNLAVKIDNIQSNSGYIYISLYSTDEGFPSDISHAEKVLKVKAKKGFLTVNFKDIPIGNYAVSVFQDINSNKKLDTSFMGIPKEPIGVSNNIKGFMGPPSFNDCKFLVKSSTKIIINLDEM